MHSHTGAPIHNGNRITYFKAKDYIFQSKYFSYHQDQFQNRIELFFVLYHNPLSAAYKKGIMGKDSMVANSNIF